MTADDTTTRAAAEVITAHVGKPANGGTASGAWVDCACLAEVKGVSRDHATSLHRKHVARALDAAGLLATPEHDAAVIEKFLREQHTPSVRIENPEAITPLLAKAWDEGFKQGGPMHDVHLDDPDAHTRNPYRKGETDE